MSEHDMWGLVVMFLAFTLMYLVVGIASELGPEYPDDK